MQAIPLPPPFPVPQACGVPDPILRQPEIKQLEWEPVPMYVETTPQDIPAPQPRPAIPEDLDQYQESEEQREEAEAEDQAEEKSSEAGKEKPASGKPNQVKPPVDLVPEIAEIQVVELPIIGIEVPMPRTEILVTATTTAGVSSVVAVGGTLFATTLFRQLQPILKPIFKIILKKLAALRKKPPPRSWSRERLLQKRLKVRESHPGK